MKKSTESHANLLVRTLFISGALAMSTPFGALASGNASAEKIAEIRAATARYEDVNVALAEGYIPDPSGHCVNAAHEGLPAEWGAMGVHYIRPDVLGITATNPRVDGNGLNTDFLKPSILLYEPQSDGSLTLVGVENLIFAKAWRAAGHAKAPTFEGRDWDYMADNPETAGDEAHGFEPHYDQHVWFVDNPLGNLMPFNPAITCAHHHGDHN